MPDDPQEQERRYMTHEEFARERALKRLRKSPPPTRDPESLELRSEVPQQPDPEEDARDQKARLYDRLSPARVPAQMRLFNRAMDESRENVLLAVAVISMFLPFGWILALWPAFSSSGRAGAVAIFSLVVNAALAIFVWGSIYRTVYVFFF